MQIKQWEYSQYLVVLGCYWLLENVEFWVIKVFEKILAL